MAPLIGHFVKFFLAASLLTASLPSAAKEEKAQVERLRAQVASQVQLMAAGLLDELVYEWIQNAPFEQETPVFLASLSVPMGMGTGLSTFLENHFFELVLRNPASKVRPVHCPTCTSLVMISKPEGTLVGKGIDLPQTLEQFGKASQIKHALHLDFEAEGSSLVLRARMTGLQPEMPLIYARSLSTSTASPALLRDSQHLKSASEARQEYLDLLKEKSPVHFPVRAIVRDYATYQDYASGMNNPVSSIPPFVWFELGAEVSFTQARKWTGEVNVGFTTLDRAHEGWSLGGRVTRLVSGESRSLTHPDVYLFLGGTIITLSGTNAASFRQSPATPAELAASLQGDAPRVQFGSWKFGAETRIRSRFSAGFFMEGSPSFARNNVSMGRYLETPILDFTCIGLEVGLWF